MMEKIKKHPIIDTILSVRGNTRACMYTEPLWGIPYNLYAPFASVYMAAIGLSDVNIGLVSSLFLLSQFVASIFSGVVTDKLGRRMTTLIFDLISWSVPTLLWTFAQNMTWFVVAAMFNGLWRMTTTSWDLLLVEDTDPKILVHVFSAVNVAGLIASFVAPIAYLCVRSYGMEQTVRVLYAIAFVMMTAKFIILYFCSHETGVGVRRMEEARGKSIFTMLGEYKGVLQRIAGSRKTVLTLALMVCYLASKGITEVFWSLLVTSKLSMTQESLSIFSMIRSIVMLLSYFFIVSRLSMRRFKNPLLFCFLAQGASQLLLILMPPGNLPLLVLSVLLEAVALSMLYPLTSTLQMLNIHEEERARVLGIFSAVVFLIIAPFPFLSGQLSEVNRVWPFYINLTLYALGGWLTVGIWREQQKEDRAREMA